MGCSCNRELPRRLLQRLEPGDGGRRARMPENGDVSGRRDDSVQEFETLGAEFRLKHGHPCDVSAGSGEAGDVAGLDWIGMGDEDDGDRGCRCLQGSCEERAVCGDQIRLEPDQVGREFGEPSGVTLDPPVLDPNVHALVPAALPQTRPEGLPPNSLVGVRGFVPQDADAVHFPRLLSLGGARHGEGASQRGQQEAAAVHQTGSVADSGH